MDTDEQDARLASYIINTVVALMGWMSFFGASWLIMMGKVNGAGKEWVFLCVFLFVGIAATAQIRYQDKKKEVT